MVSIIPSRYTRLSPPFKIGGPPASELCCTVSFGIAGFSDISIEFMSELQTNFMFADPNEEKPQLVLDCDVEFMAQLDNSREFMALLEPAYAMQTELDSGVSVSTELDNRTDCISELEADCALGSELDCRNAAGSLLNSGIGIMTQLQTEISRPKCNPQE